MIAIRRAVTKVAITSLLAKPIVRRNRLKQGRFSRAVLTGQETDARVKNDFVQLADSGHVKGIILPVRNPLAQQC